MAVTYTEEDSEHGFVAEDNKPVVSYLFKYARLWMSTILVISDFLCLAVSGWLAVYLRSLMKTPFAPSLYHDFIVLTFIFIGMYFVRGLYPTIGLGAVEELRRLTTTTSLVFLVLIAFLFAIKSQPIYSRLTFGMAWIFALGLVPLGRSVTRTIFARLNLWGEPVILAGDPEQARKIGKLLKYHPKIGLRPTIVCEQSSCVACREQQTLNAPNNTRNEACQNCPACLARVALVVYSNLDELPAIRDQYRDTFERVLLVNSEDGGLSLAAVSVIEFGSLTGLEIRHNLLNSWSQFQKRVFDLVVTSFALILLLPVLGIIALLIKLDSHGPVFYHQERIGKGGKRFKMLKFRSMQVDADEMLGKYLEKDPGLGKEWTYYQKLSKDPRITRVGNILRSFSLDELPQLWNIFIGEMSLVGPRPIMADQQRLYGSGFEHYIRVMPGLTGLWQVSGRNKTTFVRRTELDVQYVMSWSVWLDLYIIVRTVWVVLRQEGAW